MDGNGGDGGGADELFDAAAASGFEEIASAGNVGVVEFARVANVEAIVGSNVENAADTVESAEERGRVAEVAEDALDGERINRAEVAGGTNKNTDAVTASDELASDVAAEEAGCASEEGGHSIRGRYS